MQLWSEKTEKGGDVLFSLLWSKCFLLTSENLDLHAPDLPGIYQLLCEACGTVYPLYICKSMSSLNETMRHFTDGSRLDHQMIDRLVEKGRVYFRFAPYAGNRLDLLDMEWFFISHYRPAANQNLAMHSNRFDSIRVNVDNTLPPISIRTA